MRTAIVLSGHTAALGIVRSLGIMGVPVIVVHYGKHDFAGCSRFVQKSLRAPHPEQNEAEFIEFLIECSKLYPEAILFPGTDEALVAVARNKSILEKYFLVACAGWDVTRRIIDKKFTYHLADNCSVPAPRTVVLHSLEQARTVATTIGFPCIVKPCQVHLFSDRFGRKMINVKSMNELEEAFTMAADAGVEVLLQELIPGDDQNVVNYNSYVWDGNVLSEFTAVHIRNGPPWIGPPRVVVSRKVPEVIESGRRLLSELGFNGYSCIEFKYDARDGRYKVLDVNGRHNLSTLLAVRCGINFPWLHFKHLSEGIVPVPSAFLEEVYWIDLFRDIGYTSKFLTRERHSLTEYFRPYLEPHVFAIFDRTDMKPFFRRVVSYRTNH